MDNLTVYTSFIFSPDVFAYKIAEKLQENFISAFILMVSKSLFTFKIWRFIFLMLKTFFFTQQIDNKKMGFECESLACKVI